MEKKLQKTCPTDYSLLIVEDIWQTHYQILPILFLKEFVKLNVNTDMMKIKCEACGIKCKHCDWFIEYKL